jgi:hypothetical protein
MVARPSRGRHGAGAAKILDELNIEPFHSTFAILPGEAVGPFRLGMSCERVREVAQRKLSIACETEGNSHIIGDTGLVVGYDDKGYANKVEARWGPADPTYPTPNQNDFVLFGKDVSQLDDTTVTQLCEKHWPDVARVYTGIEVPSAGFKAACWDRGDGYFCSYPLYHEETREKSYCTSVA